MASTEFAITWEIEPIVKLLCRNLDCKFNQMNCARNRQAYCNLKLIEIDRNGHCVNQETKPKADPK